MTNQDLVDFFPTLLHTKGDKLFFINKCISDISLQFDTSFDASGNGELIIHVYDTRNFENHIIFGIIDDELTHGWIKSDEELSTDSQVEIFNLGLDITYGTMDEVSPNHFVYVFLDKQEVMRHYTINNIINE